MTDEDLKKIQKLIKDEIRPVKDIVEVTKKKVDSQEAPLHLSTLNDRSIKDQQSIMNEKLDDIKSRLDDPDTGLQRINDRLDANTASLMTIEQEIGVYKEMSQINGDNIKKIDRRLNITEEELAINPPPELVLVA